MKYELIHRTVNPLRNIFWHWLPGRKVSLTFSSDDNGYYLEDDLGGWLTDNVGKQGTHWDWRYSYLTIIGGLIVNNDITIYIKICKSKQHLSSILLLRWS